MNDETSGAAEQGAGGKPDGDPSVLDLAAVSEALEALRLAWGAGYLFGHDEQGYWAAGRIGTGIKRAASPAALAALLDGNGARS